LPLRRVAQACRASPVGHRGELGGRRHGAGPHLLRRARFFSLDGVFYPFFIKRRGQKKGWNMDTKDPQVILGLPTDSQNHKRKARIHGGGGRTSTTNANRLCLPKKIQPRDGCQQRVAEVVVAKHPPVERASIHKRPGSLRGDLSNSIHP
jgi:hypothetical protein